MPTLALARVSKLSRAMAQAGPSPRAPARPARTPLADRTNANWDSEAPDECDYLDAIARAAFLDAPDQPPPLDELSPAGGGQTPRRRVWTPRTPEQAARHSEMRRQRRARAAEARRQQQAAALPTAAPGEDTPAGEGATPGRTPEQRARHAELVRGYRAAAATRRMATKELDLLVATHDASGSSAIADALRFAHGLVTDPPHRARRGEGGVLVCPRAAA